MREIKFRAWVNKSNNPQIPANRMYQVGVVDHNNAMIVSNGKLEFWLTKAHKDFELMQYTGLKDKNGKEIYEGDIIWFVPTKQAVAVEWLDDKAGFNVTGKPTKNLENYEVIGNIHQDGDLLK